MLYAREFLNVDWHEVVELVVVAPLSEGGSSLRFRPACWPETELVLSALRTSCTDTRDNPKCLRCTKTHEAKP